MELRFSDEQEMMRKMVRDFARREIAPFVARMEEEELYPLEIIRKMGKAGLMGIPVPESLGGAEADFLSYILAIQEISQVSAAVGVILSVHTSVGTFPILLYGTEEQKKKYVPKLAAGEWIGAFALTEPHAGSDAGSIKMSAVRDGDHYVLNGTKVFITNGGAADTYVTFAVTEPGKGSRGITAFVVEKDTPGFTVGKMEKKMGLHGSNTASLLFENAVVPAQNRLGEEGQGFEIAMSNLDSGRIGIAAQALGIAEAALTCSVDYAKKRVQFGRPIAAQQGVSFKLADMAARIEAAKMLIYRAADLRSRGIKCGREASMAKCFASDTAMQAAVEAVQIHGGYGYTKELPVERLFRDAKVTQIYEGTNEIQRLVMARDILERNSERHSAGRQGV